VWREHKDEYMCNTKPLKVYETDKCLHVERFSSGFLQYMDKKPHTILNVSKSVILDTVGWCKSSVQHDEGSVHSNSPKSIKLVSGQF